MTFTKLRELTEELLAKKLVGTAKQPPGFIDAHTLDIVSIEPRTYGETEDGRLFIVTPVLRMGRSSKRVDDTLVEIGACIIIGHESTGELISLSAGEIRIWNSDRYHGAQEWTCLRDMLLERRQAYTSLTLGGLRERFERL